MFIKFTAEQVETCKVGLRHGTQLPEVGVVYRALRVRVGYAMFKLGGMQYVVREDCYTETSEDGLINLRAQCNPVEQFKETIANPVTGVKLTW